MANVSDKVQQIRQAVYGKDVRESIASGIEAINDETESTTARQANLETTFQQLIINAGNSNAEIVAARVDVDNNAHPTLRDRLNAIEEEIDTKANQSDLESTRAIAVDAQNKANNPLAQIPDNSIPSSKLKQSTDTDKIHIEHLGSDVISAMTGQSPVGTVPTDGSVTTEKIADGAVTKNKLESALKKHVTEDWAEDNIAYGIVDSKGHCALYIDNEGRTHIINPAFSNNSIEELAIKGNIEVNEKISGILYAIVDSKLRMAELVIGEDGKVPQWVLEAWKQRMNLGDALTFADVDNSKKAISCWGDSLTAGAGGGGVSYPSVLAQLSGRTVYNMGVGGEASNTIAARQGGLVMMVNNITIPADTTPVKIADYNNPLKDNWGKSVYPLRQGSAGVNPCYIAGIKGTLSISQSSSTSTDAVWYFTRETPGEEVVINRPTPIITDAMINRRSDIMVIWIGQNGGYSSTQELINQIKAMVDFNNAIRTEYVVCGLTSGTAESRASMEYEMLQAFGRRFINLREELSKFGLEDAGITPTQADLDAMAVGAVPPSLLVDSVHFNAAGYTVIAKVTYQKLKELNII